ncbi:hypothetical protein DN748_17620 [Sinomicrobium soli]|nr:hypothetical protein DN748_17620 [Sinomicrobium sp. N-1-3-6]
MKWKKRLKSIILIGSIYAGILFLFDYLSEDKLHSIIRYIIQGMLFGIIFHFFWGGRQTRNNTMGNGSPLPKADKIEDDADPGKKPEN